MQKEDRKNKNLVLVNACHPFRKSGELDLKAVDPRFPDILMQREAADQLRGLLEHISARDFIVPVSGYRSAREQREIYEDSLRENGEEFTRKYVALPGCSEHETGLAIDLGLNSGEIDFICPDFPYEGICNVFRKCAPEYGFIQRYTREKEEVTGISHEPWHFRYVGEPHAKIITEKGISLEEYMDV